MLRLAIDTRPAIRSQFWALLMGYFLLIILVGRTIYHAYYAGLCLGDCFVVLGGELSYTFALFFALVMIFGPLMANASSLLKLVKLVLRFLVSGGIATAAHWLVLWALVSVHVDAVLASSFGAFVGAVINYFLQYFFTFKTKRSHKQAVAAYLPAVVFSWCLNLALFYGLYGHLFADAMAAQVVTTGIIMVVNFLLYKRVVFRAK